MIKKILFILSNVLFIFWAITQAKEITPMMLFWGDGCPHCEAEKSYISEFKKNYNFILEEYEVYYNRENQKLMDDMAKKFNTTFNWVPVIIMGDDYFLWADKAQTEKLLKKYATENIVVTEKEIKEQTIENQIIEKNEPIIQKKQEPNEEIASETEDTVDQATEDRTTKLFGKEISLKSVWPMIFWVLLWLADGINPCMFWVLIFLLTYLISIWSKKKVLYSGAIFIITTFVLYFGIMYLMHKLIFSTSMLLPYIGYIKYGIWILAILMWLIEIKDFFRYGKWISLAIPKFMKPTLEYITMKGTYMSAFILAVLSSFVELPCTIGIPLSYVGAVGDKMNIFLALGIYNIFFIIPLLIIILWIYFWFSAFKLGDQEMTVNKLSNKKLMRLFAGIILIGIWILFLMKIL